MIYFIKPVENPTHVKIGYTSADDASNRLSGIQVGHPEKLEVWHTMPGGQKEELRLHHIFSEARCSGEWFKINNGILSFLSLPVYDQIEISRSVSGENLSAAMFGIYLGFDGDLAQAMTRMACILGRMDNPVSQSEIDSLKTKLEVENEQQR